MLEVKNDGSEKFVPGNIYTLMTNKFGDTEIIATCSNVFEHDNGMRKCVQFTNVLKLTEHSDNPSTVTLKKLLRGASIGTEVTLSYSDIYASGLLIDEFVIEQYKKYLNTYRE